MNITTFLEWWFKGAWHRIGWGASTAQSRRDLRAHGAALAEHGGWYRLVQPSVYRDAPPVVVHQFGHVRP